MGTSPDSPSVGIPHRCRVSPSLRALTVAALFLAAAATTHASDPGWARLIIQGVIVVVYALAWSEGTRIRRLRIGVLLACATVWGLALARAAPAVLTRDAILDPQKVAPWFVIPVFVATAAAAAATRTSAPSAARPAFNGCGDFKLTRAVRTPAAVVALATIGNTFAAGWWAAGVFIAFIGIGGALVGFLRGNRLATLVVDALRGGRSERRLVWALLLVALALRIAAVVTVDLDLRLRPDYRPGPDGEIFHEAAKRIAAGRVNILRDKEPVLWDHNPGPTLFYAAWYASLGDRYLPLGLAQALLGAAGCWLTWQLASLAGGPAAGIIALMLVAGRGYLVAYQARLGAEAIAFFLIPLSAWYLVRARDAAGNVLIGPAAIAGLVLGVATLFRPEFLAFPIAAAGWLVAHPKRRRRLLGAVMLVLVAGLPTGFWIFRNARVHGHASLQGNPDNLTMPRSQALGLFPAVLFAEGRYGQVLHTTVQSLTRNPTRSVEALWLDTTEKMVRLFDVTGYSEPPLLLYATTRAGVPLAIGGILLLLTGIGAVAGLRAGIQNPATLCLLVITSKTVLHIPLKIAYWYRVTMEPFLMVLVGIGVAALLSRATQRNWQVRDR